MTLVLKNDIREVSRLGDFLKAALEEYSLADIPGRDLRLAVEEAVVNVISYAYPEGVEGEISIELTAGGTTAEVRISDAGAPFDPTRAESPDTTLAAPERQIGGLGIFLLRELTDEIRYERREGKNILTLIKNLL